MSFTTDLIFLKQRYQQTCVYQHCVQSFISETVPGSRKQSMLTTQGCISFYRCSDGIFIYPVKMYYEAGK